MPEARRFSGRDRRPLHAAGYDPAGYGALATETRFGGIGKTPSGRHVFLVFTIREKEGKKYIRPISARYMHKMEIERYEKENPDL